MALTNNLIVRKYIGGSDDVSFSPFIDLAESELRQVLDDYDTVDADLVANGENAARKSKELRLAESLLAIAYSTIPLGLRMADGGGFIATLGAANGTNDLLEMDDLETAESKFRGMAANIINRYASTQATEDESDLGLDGVNTGDISIYAI
jgi:hypothetical protein